MVRAGKTTPIRQRAALDRLRRLEGKHNPLLKELRRAFTHAELTNDGYCAIEGLHLVEEAIRSGLRLKAVFFSESAANRAHKLLPQLSGHVETFLLPDRIFASSIPSETPQGIAALVQWKEASVADVLARSAHGSLLVVVEVQDPGNLGTILRSAEAFGAGGVLLAEGTVNLLNAKVLRGSAGSAFRLPVARVQLMEAISTLREQNIRLLATSSHKGTPLPEASLSGALAVFIGNEGSGLPRNMMSQMDEILVIPHSSVVESLNAGGAASIVRAAIPTPRQTASAQSQGTKPTV